MPTRNPRVNVCVTPEQHQLLGELGHMSNRSAASLVRDMVDAATPLMRSAVPLMRLAEDAKGQTREAARDALEEVLQALQALSQDPNQLDLLKLLPEGSDEVEPAAPPAASGASEDDAAAPRLVTRGSGGERTKNRHRRRG